MDPVLLSICSSLTPPNEFPLPSISPEIIFSFIHSSIARRCVHGLSVLLPPSSSAVTPLRIGGYMYDSRLCPVSIRASLSSHRKIHPWMSHGSPVICPQRIFQLEDICMSLVPALSMFVHPSLFLTRQFTHGSPIPLLFNTSREICPAGEYTHEPCLCLVSVCSSSSPFLSLVRRHTLECRMAPQSSFPKGFSSRRIDASASSLVWSLSIHTLSTRPPVHLSICSPVHLFICSAIHLFICSSIQPYTQRINDSFLEMIVLPYVINLLWVQSVCAW